MNSVAPMLPKGTAQARPTNAPFRRDFPVIAETELPDPRRVGPRSGGSMAAAGAEGVGLETHTRFPEDPTERVLSAPQNSKQVLPTDSLRRQQPQQRPLHPATDAQRPKVPNTSNVTLGMPKGVKHAAGPAVNMAEHDREEFERVKCETTEHICKLHDMGIVPPQAPGPSAPHLGKGMADPVASKPHYVNRDSLGWYLKVIVGRTDHLGGTWYRKVKSSPICVAPGIPAATWDQQARE
ncbi:hypothetical protein LshimejAT787_0604940 [Lyophyllum shimeji]|uniref:Uncharacterized protein n=1 Tax=Lyophyllum shimeji TaxID=47721 RepID=A0A9P3PQ38_LYOSH|nr:hypothetical protein LshimejAT787_0604940 [Lyophyllum shimeji]